MKDIDLYNGYDYQQFSVLNGAVNDNVTPTNVPMRIIGYVIIDTDEDITVRFNATDAPARPLLAADAPLIYSDLGISKIYVSNSSGSTATVKVDALGIKEE